MDAIHFEKISDICVLTLSRPEVRNALSSSVIQQLSEYVDELTRDECTVRAVVITGAEGKAFSAGADLKERQGMTEGATMDFVSAIQSTLQKIATLPMPTIAAINGDAFGGGLELALACDIRVIAAHARVGLTECSLGIIPGAGGTQRLPRIVGIAQAMELIFSARRIDAQEAMSLGLANFLMPDAESAKVKAQEIAGVIATNAPLAIRAAKAAILASCDNTVDDGLVIERASYHEILESADRKEGLRAFAEKRAPQFIGA